MAAAPIDSIISSLASSPSTSAYLVFCTPYKVYSLEVDNRKISPVSSSPTFLAITNYDIAQETPDNRYPISTAPATPTVCFMRRVIADSISRKTSAQEAYREVMDAGNTTPTGSINLEQIIWILNYNNII